MSQRNNEHFEQSNEPNLLEVFEVIRNMSRDERDAEKGRLLNEIQDREMLCQIIDDINTGEEASLEMQIYELSDEIDGIDESDPGQPR